MKLSEKRTYLSPVRLRQADDTRRRITEAARKLFLAQGFAQTTIDSIASEAAVSSQTVYAVFRSKQGILAEILERARFGAPYEKLVKQALNCSEPKERLRFAAKIARRIYDSEKAEYALLKAAPEMAEMEREHECRRFESQKPTFMLLAKSGKLKPGLKKDDARDIFWTLTGRDIYRMLVVDRRWPSAKYEKWLGQTLIDSLISDSET